MLVRHQQTKADSSFRGDLIKWYWCSNVKPGFDTGRLYHPKGLPIPEQGSSGAVTHLHANPYDRAVDSRGASLSR